MVGFESGNIISQCLVLLLIILEYGQAQRILVDAFQMFLLIAEYFLINFFDLLLEFIHLAPDG